MVGVSQLSANMSNKHFVHPDEFLPARWLGGEDFLGDVKRARKPFSYGPRNCAGQKYVPNKTLCCHEWIGFID